MIHLMLCEPQVFALRPSRIKPEKVWMEALEVWPHPLALPPFLAVQVGPAGGVWVEVVLAEAWWVVGGGEHVGGGQRWWEVVACLLVNVVKVVLVQRLWQRWVDTREKKISRSAPDQDTHRFFNGWPTLNSMGMYFSFLAWPLPRLL